MTFSTRRFVAIFATLAALLGFTALVAPQEAKADPCTGTWGIVMGGLVFPDNVQDSSYMQGDQRVGYPSFDPVAGLNELDRLINKHRAECPGDYIKVAGHSEGAGIVHAWVSRAQHYPNLSAVLIADPKRKANGLGLDGIANMGGQLGDLPVWGLGYPLGGVDDNFGSIPVLQVCRASDVVCSNNLNWRGYVNGEHGWYDMNVHAYPNGATGQWWSE